MYHLMATMCSAGETFSSSCRFIFWNLVTSAGGAPRKLCKSARLYLTILRSCLPTLFLSSVAASGVGVFLLTAGAGFFAGAAAGFLAAAG